MRGRLYTMTDEIRPLYAGAPRVVGTAVTVKAPRGDNAAVKAGAEFITPGDVLVIDAQGFTGWCAGGYSMLAAAVKDRGLAGVIVNGAYRDVAEFRQAHLGLYGISLSAGTGPKLGPGEINVPVACGGVVLHAGDLVVADEDGVVVVPRANVAEVLEACRARVEKEEASRERYRAGELSLDVQGMREELAAKGLTYT